MTSLKNMQLRFQLLIVENDELFSDDDYDDCNITTDDFEF